MVRPSARRAMVSKAVKLKVRLGQLCLNSKSMAEAAEIFEELVDFRDNDDDVKEFLERYESMKDVVQDEGAEDEVVEAVTSVIDSDNYDFRDLEKPFDNLYPHLSLPLPPWTICRTDFPLEIINTSKLQKRIL